MRLEIDVGEAGGAPRGREIAALLTRPRRRRIDRFDVLVLALFAGISMWVLGLDLWQVVVHSRVWTGTDGVYVVDQMQYLAWIQSASHHLLSANLFVLRHTPSDYLQPAVMVSAGLTALGMAPSLSLLLWKPVAVGCAFVAIRAWCRRSLVGTWPRRAALVLALFYGSFSVVYGDFGLVGDIMPSFLSWGYTFGLLAVGVLLLALLSYERARRTGRRIWVAGALGAVASLLHPWQGELLVVIVVAAELLMRRRERRPSLRLPLTTVIITGVPLVYYLLLGKTDLSWQLARDASKHTFSLWTILLAVAPLAIPAAFGYRGRSGSFLTAIARTWPFAALLIWVLSASQVSATPLHAFDGITIPLAVLAVRGSQQLRALGLPTPRRLGAIAVAAATIPATVYLMASNAELVRPTGGNPNFISADEHHALQYLAHDPQTGGVLTRFYLGTIVPAETGRRTYVGDCLWSEPNCIQRAQTTQLLLDGTLNEASARSFVASTGARFVLTDCSTAGNLDYLLAPFTESVTRFGCVNVYRLSTGPGVITAPEPVSSPLAQSAANAALRASGRQQRRVQSG
jgi:hypothetical protein